MILVENVQLVKKITSLTLLTDYAAEIVISTGVIGSDNIFSPLTYETMHLSPEQVTPILLAEVTSGKARKDDISDAIYSYLISENILTGTII